MQTRNKLARLSLVCNVSYVSNAVPMTKLKQEIILGFGVSQWPNINLTTVPCTTSTTLYYIPYYAKPFIADACTSSTGYVFLYCINMVSFCSWFFRCTSGLIYLAVANEHKSTWNNVSRSARVILADQALLSHLLCRNAYRSFSNAAKIQYDTENSPQYWAIAPVTTAL